LTDSIQLSLPELALFDDIRVISNETGDAVFGLR
jgi:hypothetical protein